MAIVDEYGEVQEHRVFTFITSKKTSRSEPGIASKLEEEKGIIKRMLSKY